MERVAGVHGLGRLEVISQKGEMSTKDTNARKFQVAPMPYLRDSRTKPDRVEIPDD
jgi:hypothetical protein